MMEVKREERKGTSPFLVIGCKKNNNKVPFLTEDVQKQHITKKCILCGCWPSFGCHNICVIPKSPQFTQKQYCGSS